MSMFQNEKFIRQSDLVDNSALSNLVVTVIGAGATGSYTSLCLSKMGINKIVVYDDDKVELHNTPNQVYGESYIGKKKVDSLHQFIKEVSDVDIVPNATKVTDKDHLYGHIVVVCVDSMSARKEIYKSFLNSEADILIDVRQGRDDILAYGVVRKDSCSTDNYEKTLHTDAEGDMIPCTERSTAYNSMWTGALVGSIIKRIIMNKKLPKMLHVNCGNLYVSEVNSEWKLS